MRPVCSLAAVASPHCRWVKRPDSWIGRPTIAASSRSRISNPAWLALVTVPSRSVVRMPLLIDWITFAVHGPWRSARCSLFFPSSAALGAGHVVGQVVSEQRHGIETETMDDEVIAPRALRKTASCVEVAGRNPAEVEGARSRRP